MKKNTVAQYKNTAVLLIALIICFVIAMYLMWVYDGGQNAVATGLRWISAIVCVALFSYLCSSVYKQLRSQHRLLKMARKQKHALLSSLEEGFCWVGEHGDISGNISHALPKLLGCEVTKGMDFCHLMASVVDTKHVDDLVAHIRAFNVIDQDVKSLKPSESIPAVPITCLVDKEGVECSQQKYIDIQLHQVHTLTDSTALHSSSVIHRLADSVALLVTMTDVTDAVVLKRTLNQLQADSHNTVDHLLTLFEKDAEVLQTAVRFTKTTLTELDEAVRLAAQKPHIARAVVRSATSLTLKLSARHTELGLKEWLGYTTSLEQSVIQASEQAFVTAEGLEGVLLELAAFQEQVGRTERLLLKLETLAAKKYAALLKNDARHAAAMNQAAQTVPPVQYQAFADALDLERKPDKPTSIIE